MASYSATRASSSAVGVRSRGVDPIDGPVGGFPTGSVTTSCNRGTVSSSSVARAIATSGRFRHFATPLGWCR